ncbi:unnamed protein product [Protopolystoma xenopodis]|uniref:Sodium/calcium exchanger membrane region domain-containing protein n=1 Tax=Protopolystoma xenopodis TaxID=117903 RepID=A0A448XD57_9PLAT|nr:unnamed protein product [Protopolystoma xenopodis]
MFSSIRQCRKLTPSFNHFAKSRPVNNKVAGLIFLGNSPIPIVAVPLFLGTCMAIFVFSTARWDMPPRAYHRPFFATLGFITSIVWIYALAHELVNLLETLGIVWMISEAILGLTIMALATSLGGKHEVTSL